MTDNLINGTEHKAQQLRLKWSITICTFKAIQGKKESLSTNYARIASYAYSKTMTKFLSFHSTEPESFSVENIDAYLHDLEIGKVSQTHKRKLGKLDFISLKISVLNTLLRKQVSNSQVERK